MHCWDLRVLKVSTTLSLSMLWKTQCSFLGWWTWTSSCVNSAILHTSPLHFFIFSTNHKHYAFKTNQNRDIVLAPHNLGLHIKINFFKKNLNTVVCIPQPNVNPRIMKIQQKMSKQNRFTIMHIVLVTHHSQWKMMVSNQACLLQVSPMMESTITLNLHKFVN
jgi:hypothetical protein